MTRGECSAEDSWSVIVSAKPEIVSIDSIKYHTRTIQVSGGATPYHFFIEDVTPTPVTDATIDKIPFGYHNVAVVDDAGCSVVAGFNVLSPGIKIPKILSPNGDGVDDRITSPVIKEAYPDAKICVYDRYGKKLAEYKGSDEGWDGTYGGKEMKSTDYWYEIEIQELQQTYTGHFTLMRQ